MDRRSGFNLLQASVLEGNYIVLWKADTLLDNFVNGMNLDTTGNNADVFPGKTAVDILSSLEKREPGHAVIDTLYKRMVNIFNTFTDLHWCTCGDDSEKAGELVLNGGVDVDIPAFRNCTPLLWASMSSSSNFIKTLVDLGADVNVQRTNDKATPLTLAADLNNYMAIRVLLEHKADANIQNFKGNTPLHVSVRKGFYKLSQLLIEKGCNINLRNKNGRTPLHDAAIKKHENFFKLLLKNNADVNIQDMNGDAPLHWSVFRGLFKGSQLLINAGSNINLRNKKGRTPVYIAVDNKIEQLIELLLESNADVGMRYKQDPKDRVYIVRAKDKGKLAWHYVMVEKHLLGLFLKRMDRGSFNVTDFGTVLQTCSGKKLPKDPTVKVLKKTVSVNTEIQGDTLLHVAGANNSSAVIDLLVKYGADINAQNEDGFTPLHIAAIHGNMQVVEKLVDLEADVSLATADGKDAAGLAHLNEETEIEEYLKAKLFSSQ